MVSAAIHNEEVYPYGGSVPLNLARLHASVAHYSLQHGDDDYLVKIVCVSDCHEAAQLVRTISEDTRKQNEGVNDQDWSDREWIADDMEMRERFLLGFPCLNSFSALLMLRRHPLRQLLMLNLTQLQEQFPWLPLKVAKFFTEMCHVCFQPNLSVHPLTTGGSEASNHWQNSEGIHTYNEPTTAINLDDSLQYTTEESYPTSAVNHDTEPQHTQQLLLPSFPTGTSALWSSEENSDMPGLLTSQPVTANEPTSIVHQSPNTELVEERVSDFNHFTPQQRHQRFQNTQLPHDKNQSGQNYSTTTFVTTTMGKSPSPAHISLFEPRTTSSPSGGADGSAKLSDHHFLVPENLYKEYYGNDPMPPRLLTSGMVRRTPRRQPIKSLDLDIGPSPLREGPRLQANDRAAALDNGSRYTESTVSSGQGVSEGVSYWPGGWAKVQGVEGLMTFHSRQSSGGREPRVKSPLFSDTSPGATSQRFRQKRPLPRSPLFDCRVPNQSISPQSGGAESSLFPSPNVSLGSVKLSPLRKRRLVYKKLPCSLDGQTKLAFE
ncbi:Protein shortage in chiasmata 1 ortholog [Geodia barretti]|uniref:Protein shortage in chiasmata 1 ortholog n=1 Tax=Geodia barretti TaxID=519541 RepID=A0AA35R6X0_GEOBA|nr:Protein shortage in chiasmata 1 ortholog [Geodia barretti]